MIGTARVNWILRGRMLQHKVVWSPIDLKALAVMTYDAEDKVYRQWYFDSNGAIPRDEGSGKWDESTQTFTWKGTSADGGTNTQAHRFIDENTLEWTMLVKDSTGKVHLDLTAKAKRKKR